MTPSELFCLTRTDLKNVQELRHCREQGKWKQGCHAFWWISHHSLPRRYFSGLRSVQPCAQDFQTAHHWMGSNPKGWDVSKAWCCGGGCTCRGAGGMLAHLVRARFAAPMLQGIWPRAPCGHSPGTRGHWPPHHIRVPLDPQKLHEEQRVTLQPTGPVWDPDTPDVLSLHCEDDLWRLVTLAHRRAARKMRDHHWQFWSVRSPFNFF